MLLQKLFKYFNGVDMYIIITILRIVLCPYPGVAVCAVKLEGDLHSVLGFGDGIMTLRQCDCPATSAYRV